MQTVAYPYCNQLIVAFLKPKKDPIIFPIIFLVPFAQRSELFSILVDISNAEDQEMFIYN